MTGLWVVLGVLAAATVVGLLLRVRDGRVRDGRVRDGWLRRRPPAGAGSTVPVLPDVGRPGTVVLLQLSSSVCAPCRQARRVLAELATATPGVRHVEVDVSEQPELAARLRVRRTPTTVALDGEGRELLRVSGVPRRAEL